MMKDLWREANYILSLVIMNEIVILKRRGYIFLSYTGLLTYFTRQIEKAKAIDNCSK